MRWFRKPNANRADRRAGRVRPVIEQLETRDVPAGLFLQGQTYLDANNNGQRRPIGSGAWPTR